MSRVVPSDRMVEDLHIYHSIRDSSKAPRLIQRCQCLASQRCQLLATGSALQGLFVKYFGLSLFQRG